MQPPITIAIPNSDDSITTVLRRTIEELVPESLVSVRSFLDPPRNTAEWVERTRGAHGIILGWRLPDEVLDASDTLEAISFLGTGIADQVSIPLCEQKNIATYTVSGYGDRSVAEHAVALLLSVWHSVPTLDAATRAGTWPRTIRPALFGKTLGIIGYGGIGSRMAQMGAALGLDVIVWSRSLEPGTPLPAGRAVTLDELLDRSHAISLHLALTPETENFVDERFIARMRQGVVLVNTSRGGILDHTALLEALRTGHVRGAGIDVFPTEPVPLDDPILQEPGVVVTPHIGYNTHEAMETLLESAAHNMIGHFWPDITTTRTLTP